MSPPGAPEATSTVLATALAWHHAGCSVLPTRTDGSKAPNVTTWTRYQSQRPPINQITDWFTNGHPGLGLVCGTVSGNLEMLELEGRAVAEGAIPTLTTMLTDADLAELWVRLTATGYAERTPSGGLHLLYRITDGPVPGNTKLARRPATEAELADKPAEKLKVLAETRGEGGYVVIAPSNGTIHPTGLAWTIAYGQPGVVPTITADEREQLHRVVRCLDQTPEPAAQASTPRLQVVRDNGSTTPGDDFETRVDWSDQLLLGGAGWRCATRTPSGYRTWRRPGKDTPGISATTGRDPDRDRLYVFSSATEFDTEVSITKFHAYCVLHHRGDHQAAAKELRRLGYGTPTPLSPNPAATQAAAIAELLPDQAPRTLAAVDGTSARVLAEPAPAPHQYGPTEDGLARALIAHHGHQLRYCPQRGKWLHWTGHRWGWDDAETHRELALTLARALPDADGFATFKKRALSAAGITGVARLAQTNPAIVAHINTFDARPYELNTPAGIVDLRTGALTPPDPAALHTRCTSVAPDFDRTSDTFKLFLADTFGDDTDLRDYIQRLLGLSCIGTILEQLLLFPHGIGANGKSTLLEAIMHTIGIGEDGYAMAAPAEMLMIRSHSEHPAELAQLAGARLVVCSELEDGQRFAEARIKQLTGRDSINARFMRGNPFTFTPSHTMWLLGNHKPAATAGGPAFWRRVRLLPFTRVVAPERRDSRLGEKLADDAAAILAWLVRGAADYHTGGLREPKSVTEATEAYAGDQDTIARWLADACHLAAGSTQVRVAMADTRSAYESWCHEAGEVAVTPKRLGMDLRDRFGVGQARSNGRKFYVGLALLSTDTDDGDDRDRGWQQ